MLVTAVDVEMVYPSSICHAHAPHLSQWIEWRAK